MDYPVIIVTLPTSRPPQAHVVRSHEELHDLAEQYSVDGPIEPPMTARELLWVISYAGGNSYTAIITKAHYAEGLYFPAQRRAALAAVREQAAKLGWVQK